jgi:hypothetical protein|tara:strand:+ start:3070 stop:3441 length:372 start_codon:yes stop_codon:yes gene_type:complete
MTIIIGTVIVFFSIIVVLYPVFARRDSKLIKFHNPINSKAEGSPFQNEINFITQELEEGEISQDEYDLFIKELELRKINDIRANSKKSKNIPRFSKIEKAISQQKKIINDDAQQKHDNQNCSS